IEAGTPEKYYLNPSENLWKMTSAWNVVEHKDILTLNIHMTGFGNFVVTTIEGKFINIEVQKQNKEISAARCPHEILKKYSFEMNPSFLSLSVRDDPTLRLSEGTFRLFLSKLKPEEMKNYTGKIHVSKLTPEELKNN
ncbi:hypothetical protein MKW92_024729, partial [Papaver armeniacum]